MGKKKRTREGIFFSVSDTGGSEEKYNHKKRIFEKSTRECSLSGVLFKESKVKDNPVKEKYE